MNKDWLDIVEALEATSRQTTDPRTLAETLSHIAEAGHDAAAAYRCCLGELYLIGFAL